MVPAMSDRRSIFVIYDQRRFSVGREKMDRSAVLGVADSLDEALTKAEEIGDGAIWEYDLIDRKFVNGRFVRLVGKEDAFAPIPPPASAGKTREGK